jgi:CRP-like cAMP-binding protein
MNKKSINEKDKELITKFLKNIPVFKTFSDDNLKVVMESFHIISVEKGGDIVFQEDEGTDLYIVLKGKVKVSLTGKNGNELVLTALREGDFFGEMSLIDDTTRSANVVAEEDTFLGVLKRERFISILKEEPLVAFDMLTATVKRLRKADEMIETLAFLDVNERLIKLLLQTARTDGDINEDGLYRTRKRTHMELAANIGSSREAVSKALKVLTHKELIQEKDRYFLISPQLHEDSDM